MRVVCPKCKHLFESVIPKTGRRKCFRCKQSIGRHDKWYFRPDGRIEHRNCDNKEYYH